MTIRDGAASTSTNSTPTSSPPSSKESSPANSFLHGDTPKKSKRSSHKGKQILLQFCNYSSCCLMIHFLQQDVRNAKK